MNAHLLPCLLRLIAATLAAVAAALPSALALILLVNSSSVISSVASPASFADVWDASEPHPVVRNDGPDEAAQNAGHTKSTRQEAKRIFIAKDQRIADFVHHDRMLIDESPDIRQYTIEVHDVDDENDADGSPDGGDTPDDGKEKRSDAVALAQLLRVNHVQMAVTPETTFSFREGRSFDKDSINHLTVLASDPSDGDNFANQGGNDSIGGLTILSVNTLSGVVRGIQRGRTGGVKKITQNGVVSGSGSNSLRVNRQSMPSVENREWSCEIGHKDHDHSEDMERHNSLHSRHRNVLFDGHNSHEEGENNHVHAFPSNVIDTQPEKRSSITAHTIQDYSSQSTPNHPSNLSIHNYKGQHLFEINLVIDVDDQFIKKQGGTEQTVEYVNFLVSTANIIYEYELNAHLNVIRIQETNLFDDVTTLRQGLKTMREHYEGKNIGDDGFSFLRHALLGKDVGGGIAFIDSICDSKWGVGLSSGLAGKISNLDEEAMFDAFMFAHEIGHSLGSGHTFDSYDPPVDTCGDTCPKDLPIESSATIMSYCNFCSGELSNIAFTMGGVWSGVEPRFDVNNWEVHPDITTSAVSKEPNRVSHRVWDRLTSKGECIRPPPESIAINFCNNDSECEDENICTVNSCSDFMCAVTEKIDNCCGNGICEAGEPGSCRGDCGPFSIKPDSYCETCFSLDGFMFDVAVDHDAQSSIALQTIRFMIKNPEAMFLAVNLYTTSGSYLGKESQSDQWVHVGTVYVGNGGSAQAEVTIEPPISMAAGSIRGFYLSTAENIIQFEGGSYKITDERSVSLISGHGIVGKFGDALEGYALSCEVEYTAFPSGMNIFQTMSPTFHPTTLPTGSPTKAPTKVPTASPEAESVAEYYLEPENICDSNCFLTSGVMFDVGLSSNSINDILVTSVVFEHVKPTSVNVVIDIYTTSGSHKGKENLSNEWTKIQSENVPDKNSASEIVLETPIFVARGTQLSFYLVTHAEGVSADCLIIGMGPYMSTDSNGAVLQSGSVVFDLFGTSVPNYSWNGKLGYILASSPTSSPTTSSPTTSPTKDMGPFLIRPKLFCVDDCFAVPGYMFDIAGAKVDEIAVTGINFEHMAPSNASDIMFVYKTANGSYEGKEQDPSEWVLVTTSSIPESNFAFMQINFDPAIIISQGEKVGFYLKTNENIVLVGKNDESFSDDRGVGLASGSAIVQPFGAALSGYSFNGEVHYGRLSVPEVSTTFYTPIVTPTVPPPSLISNVIKSGGLCSDDCFLSKGVMFDVGLYGTSSHEIVYVDALSFEHVSPSSPTTVDVYTTVSGSYSGKEQAATEWRKIATTSVPNTSFTFKEIVLNESISIVRGEMRGFYLVSSGENVLVIGLDSFAITDNIGVQLISGSAIVGQFGSALAGYSWDGIISYSYSSQP